FTLKKNSDFPYRVIVDFYRKEVSEEKFTSPVLPTVVIDAGHGGKDPGAIGKTGTLEKDIVLDIALSLEKELWESGKVNPIMTREKDVFVGLKDRVKLTENKNAELFISIHNNADTTGRARGYRIYILSEDGKADKAEQLAAAKENESFSNFDEIKSKVLDKNVLGILYDLKLNQTISQSSKFAHVILEGFREDFKDIDTQVRRAPFHVLKLAGIPGVLFECGFISNKTDERLLKNKFYREKIAKTIKESVLRYLEEKKLLLCEVKNNYIPDYYEIKPGDTLIKISEQFKMDVDSIKKINNINETSIIYAGKKLKLKI
ncbi:MAG: N-acetylmuramoyl-L-alanine amidase, partial [Candidatus Muirbacterium halophilum]|nr:N-acetylmuramoyl-L-alanine amidase [Candidatus Muirbacterium halophilum]